MVRITASGTLRAKGSMARTAMTTISTRMPRRRRDRDLPYLRLLSEVAVESSLPVDDAPEPLCLLSEFIQVSIVLYDQVGVPGLLLAGELPLLHSPQRCFVEAPLLRPRAAPHFGDCDGDREVKILAPARLEEQRYLHDEDLCPGGLDAPVGLALYQGMQYLFEVPQGPSIAEYLAAEDFAVDAFRSSDFFPETIDDPVDGPAIVLQEVVYDLIGRGRLYARQFSQETDQRALTRSERACDGDRHRPSHGALLWRVLCYLSSRSRSASASKAPERRPLPSLLLRSEVPRCSGSRRGRSSRLGRSESESLRRRASTSMMRASTSSPERTISSGVSTWWSASSEMWIRPSTPSATSTKAPKETSLVTRPWICSPTLTRSTISCQGSFLVCLSPSEILSRSRSTSKTLTSTSSPTCTTSLGWST